MKIAWAVILLFCARFALSAWFEPGRDGDIAWQQWLGQQILQSGHIPHALGPETFTAAGAPWVPQEWALSLLLAVTSGSGLFVLAALLATACAATALALTAWSAQKQGASIFPIALCTMLTAFALQESFGVRAQVLAWPLLAAMLFILRNVRGPAVWWIVAIVALWANVHASALLAPALLVAWTVGIAIEERGWNPRVRTYALLTASCLLAVCATPLTFRLPLYALQLFGSPIRQAIQEWQPADITADSFYLGLLPLLLIALVTGIVRPRRWSEFMLFAASVWLAFGAVRNIAVCAIVIAPAVAVQLSKYIPGRVRVNQLLAERGITVAVFALVVPCAFVVVWNLGHMPRYVEGTLPQRAVAAAATRPGVHNLFCEDFAWCSLALRYSNLREFMDGRCDPFPERVWQDYRAIYAIKPRWTQLLDRDAVDMVLVTRGHALDQALHLQPRWRVAYADRTYELFIRSDALKPGLGRNDLGSAGHLRPGLGARGAHPFATRSQLFE